jgi:hypothetical protein
MKIKIAMAQLKKEEMQVEYRDRIQADTRDRMLRKIMVTVVLLNLDSLALKIKGGEKDSNDECSDC